MRSQICPAAQRHGAKLKLPLHGINQLCCLASRLSWPISCVGYTLALSALSCRDASGRHQIGFKGRTTTNEALDNRCRHRRGRSEPAHSPKMLPDKQSTRDKVRQGRKGANFGSLWSLREQARKHASVATPCCVHGLMYAARDMTPARRRGQNQLALCPKAVSQRRESARLLSQHWRHKHARQGPHRESLELRKNHACRLFCYRRRTYCIRIGVTLAVARRPAGCSGSRKASSLKASKRTRERQFLQSDVKFFSSAFSRASSRKQGKSHFAPACDMHRDPACTI